MEGEGDDANVDEEEEKVQKKAGRQIILLRGGNFQSRTTTATAEIHSLGFATAGDAFRARGQRS